MSALPPPSTWPALLAGHARQHPLALAALVLGVGGALAAFALRLQDSAGPSPEHVLWAFYGGLAGLAATSLGALPILFVRSLPRRVEDGLLGGAAGMMLAAAFFSLLQPGIEAGQKLAGTGWGGSLLVVAGMAAGVLVMVGLDAFTPHEHEQGGAFGAGHERVSRIWLFVLAVAIHNLPEGMAIGVGYAQGDLAVAVPLTAAIALQDVPEGLAVALALRTIGVPVWKAIAVTVAGGALEPLGALLGVSLVGGSAAAYPMGLGFAAGAMLFVVSHEIIPETHRSGHQTTATLGLMAGFALMLLMDTAL